MLPMVEDLNRLIDTHPIPFLSRGTQERMHSSNVIWFDGGFLVAGMVRVSTAD